ncbi:MAG: class I SAM-dependent methyltransferase [Bacteroidota bacterium]
MNTEKYKEVISANIELYTKSSHEYEKLEPQYRPENLKRVKALLKKEIDAVGARKILDLGCGTGFMINLMKEYVDEITGVDVTQVMLDRVDKSGNAKIELINHDTGSYPVVEGKYDMATAHSFLHHLYDIKPTIETAAKALRKGGVFVNELDPNYYFWEAINKLERNGNYSPLVKREVEEVNHKDEDIEKTFGVNPEVYNTAEYGKNIKGGFKEEELIETLLGAGFSKVEIKYHWFLGETLVVNNPNSEKEKNLETAKWFNEVLHSSMPLSRHLYKYVGFVATK